MAPAFRGGGRGPWKKHSGGSSADRNVPQKALRKKPRDPNGRNGVNSTRRALFAPPKESTQQPEQHQEVRQKRTEKKYKDTADDSRDTVDVSASERKPRPFKPKKQHHKRPEQQEHQQQKQQKGQQQKGQQHQKPQLSHAVFVRNLPFGIDSDSVSSVLCQFGTVTETFLVKNEMGEGKGAAFVYFADAASAQRAIAASATHENELERLSGRQQKRLTHLLAQQQQEQGQSEAAAAPGASLFLRGRRLQILPALDRDQAKSLAQTKRQERAAESAKRRGLPLAFEGLPRRPFEGLGPSEQAIARAAYDETKEKLKNPNIFVNKTRLCLRNLPNWADANFIRERVSGLLAPILKAHAESPAAAAAAATAAAAAEQNEPEQEQQQATESTQQQPKQQQKQDNINNAKEWKAKAAAAIKKVAVIREKREASQRHGAPGAPRRSLGFCFIDLGCDFAQALQLVHAVRDSSGFFASPTSQQKRDKERKPIVQFALEDARKVKIKTERIAAFAKLLKKRQEDNAQEAQKPGKTLKKKTYSRGQRQREKRRQQRLAAEQAAASGQREPQQKEPVQHRQKEGDSKQGHHQGKHSERHRASSQFSDDEVDAPRFVKEHDNSRRKRKANKQAEAEDLEEEALRKRIKLLLQGLK